jgi:hypothetical protein
MMFGWGASAASVNPEDACSMVLQNLGKHVWESTLLQTISLQSKYANTTDFRTIGLVHLECCNVNYHHEYKESCHNHGTDTEHHCGSRRQGRQSKSSVKFEIQQGIVLYLFALKSHTNLHNFLIYALSFFVQHPLVGLFEFI